MSAARTKEALAKAEAFFRQMREGTLSLTQEGEAERAERIRHLLSNYRAFAEYYFPHYCFAPLADFHVAAALAIRDNDRFRGAFQWFRGAAKSTHLGLIVPLWLKALGQFRAMILMGRTLDAATILLTSLREELMTNERYISDFGHQASDIWFDEQFVTRDGVSFYAFGKLQNVRGTRNRYVRPDLLVMDDLDDDQEVLNPQRLQKTITKLETALLGTMAMNRGRAYILGNRIADQTILTHFFEKAGWHQSRVDALTAAGESSWPENYTTEEVKAKLAEMSARDGAKEFMNTPSLEGRPFRAEDIVFAEARPWADYHACIIYIDPAYKPTKLGDFKAAVILCRYERTYFVYRAYLRRGGFNRLIAWVYDMKDLYREVRLEVFIESDGRQSGLFREWFREEANLRGVEPIAFIEDTRRKPNKHGRIAAMAPDFERGAYTFNEAYQDEADMQVLVRQLLDFEPGNKRLYDDGPDALEGGTHIVRNRSNTFTARVGPTKRR